MLLSERGREGEERRGDNEMEFFNTLNIHEHAMTRFHNGAVYTRRT